MHQTRFKVTLAYMIVVIGTSWAKHWLPGIDSNLLSVAGLAVLGYIWGRTKRPAGGTGEGQNG